MGLNKRGFTRPLRMLAVPLAFAMEAGSLAADAGAFPRPLAGLAASADSAAAIIQVNQLGFFVNDIEGLAGLDAPVTILLPSEAELAAAGNGASSFILIRNIPEGVRLSAGMSSGRLWVLPLHDVAGLKLISEQETAGTFALEFSLIGVGNKALARQVVSLRLEPFEIVGGTDVTVATAPTQSLPEEKAASAPPVLASRVAPVERPTAGTEAPPRRAPGGGMSTQEESLLLGRGEELLRQGGMAAARVLFEEMARKGSAKGALALARSYDPAYAPGSRASAPSPSLDKALEWYKRAEELGSREAKERIADLVSPRR